MDQVAMSFKSPKEKTLEQGNSVYFLAIPSIVSILVNIFFLFNVVKVIR